MKKTITLALMALAFAPMAAQAGTSRGELARDRADIREEARELRQAQRYGSPRDVREERGELRDARREYREDLHDWHHKRAMQNRQRFNAPFAYRAYQPGWRAVPSHYGARYAIAHPRAMGLPAAYAGTRWVRHYDDALLIDMRSGKVRRVIRNVF